jgi:hypothetical protein
MIFGKTKLIILSIVLVLSPCLASAGDEQQINELLKNGGNVTLENRVYTITGPIYIHSNTVLTGGPDTIIRVSPSSSQWFVGATGILNPGEFPLKNVEIYGFSIDGNLMNLPKSYANYNGGDHNCERLIYLRGSSSSFMENIKVHDMTLYDSYSDGCQIAYANNVSIYNNLVSNCQHSGIFLISCCYGIFSNNNIAGITSDCMRLDNCVNCLVSNNIYLSYTGDHANGAGMNGENGLQIADEGYSHNGGSAKPTHTTNIEVCNNTFANNGWHSVWLDSTGKGVTNVYIHGNVYKSGKEIETAGTSVNLSLDGISFENPPSLELSKKVFSSIFDILNIQFTDSGINNLTADDIHYEAKETEQGKIAGYVKIVGFKNVINIDNKTYISSPDDVLVKSSVIRAPSLTIWFGNISDTKKDVSVSIVNRTAIATMKITVYWFNYKKQAVTNKIVKGKLQESSYTFTDSCPAPDVLRRPAETKAIITYYNNSINPHTLVYVPSQGLIKVNYEYTGNSSEHVLMIGEKSTGENGVLHTNFSTCDYWRGAIPYQGEALFIPGSVDHSKLNVTCFTPYESFKITKFEYTEKAWKGESFSDWILPFALKLGVILFFLWRLLKIPFS